MLLMLASEYITNNNMNELFDLCVEILIYISKIFNISYQEANIWIFVIIEPIIFFIMLLYIIHLRKKITKLNK